MEKDVSNPALPLPDEVDGWKASQKDGIYDQESLYDYINGGAELYLSYDFKKCINRTYLRPEQPDIVVDLFDMGTSQNAYGVFSHSMETVDAAYGQGSQYSEGLLLFWKDRYYVSIMSYPETPESKKALLSLGKEIEAAIRGEGPCPTFSIFYLKNHSSVRVSAISDTMHGSTPTTSLRTAIFLILMTAQMQCSRSTGTARARFFCSSWSIRMLRKHRQHMIIL